MTAQTKLEETLEQMIDSTSLSQVLDAIGKVCIEKVSHLETNWQDYAAGKAWEKAGHRIVKLALDDNINAL